MLVGRDRLFYSGLLGNSHRERRLGSSTIYIATRGEFEAKVGDGPWMPHSTVVVPPFVGHRLHSESGLITSLCIETETVDEAEIDDLTTEARHDPCGLTERISSARRQFLQASDAGGFSTKSFDRSFFGRVLEPRPIDPRIRKAVDTLIDELHEVQLSAEACAAISGLSVSRFLHLFKSEVGTSFRTQRMWKRARRFMDHANGEVSLTNVALDLGYSDSSHFSHSIRMLFGLQPRSIREGSRGMQVCFGENYSRSGAPTS